MNKKIIIYGVSNEVFPTEHDLIEYLSTDIFLSRKGRFRYTQCKDANVILISKIGLVFGHLIVKDKIISTIEDIRAFAPAKCTYLIKESVVYKNPIKLYNELGIKITSFGKYITQEQFVEIQKRAN